MSQVRAWVPGVPGIAEAFHARFTDHVYPPHAHDTWTLMIVDDGVVRYDLHRHEHGAPTGTVLLLPPHIAHTGRSATAHGFRKWVLYLDPDVVDTASAGRVVDEPTLPDDLLHLRLDQLHRVLDESFHLSITASLRCGVDRQDTPWPGGVLEAESRLALITDRIARLLDGEPIATAAVALADQHRPLRWCGRTSPDSRVSPPPSASTTSPTCIGTSPAWSGPPRGGSPPARERLRR